MNVLPKCVHVLQVHQAMYDAFVIYESEQHCEDTTGAELHNID